MPDTMLPSKVLAALNDNELEILHLLANGHTAKSIASSLGRSETAVHERLRDARRKTGVGSSRELARLLDAQKIWDKNSDLPQAAVLAEAGEQPRSTGLSLPKGTIVMLFILPVAALGLAVAADTTPRADQTVEAARSVPEGQSPLVGSWSLDVDRIPAEERPQRVTIDFSVSPDNASGAPAWTTRIVITAADGTIRYAESTAIANGAPVPVSGNLDFIDSGSLRQPSPDTLVMTLSKAGAPVSTRVYTVAKDGQSMTETIIWGGTTVPKLETTFFQRIG